MILKTDSNGNEEWKLIYEGTDGVLWGEVIQSSIGMVIGTEWMLFGDII